MSFHFFFAIFLICCGEPELALAYVFFMLIFAVTDDS